jgi:hypothetical protein
MMPSGFCRVGSVSVYFKTFLSRATTDENTVQPILEVLKNSIKVFEDVTSM